MDTHEKIVARIEAYIKDHGMTEQEFGQAAVLDSRLVPRLRAAMGTLKIIKKVDAFMDGRTPDARLTRRRSAA